MCGIIDVATRRIVGWSISRTQTQKIVQDSLKMAVGRNPDRPNGAIFHSDRGCQYTAKKTKELVEKLGFRKSMSRPGTPSDNQPIESFWKTLKCELPSLSFLKFEEAERRQLTFKSFPKALNRLVIAGRTRTRHAFSESEFFYQLLCLFGCVLTTSVTVKYCSIRSVRISPDCHFQRVLHYFLCLSSAD